MAQQLLDLPIPDIDTTTTDVRLVVTAEGATLSLDAFDGTRVEYVLATAEARIIQALYGKAREYASQGTPFGATGTNLDRQLEANNVTVPSAATAVHTIAVTGRNSFVLPVNTPIASDGGQQYTTDAQIAFSAGDTTVEITMTAVAIGSIYNLEPGSTASLKIINDDVDPKVVIVSLDTSGADPADEDGKAALLKASKAQSLSARTAAHYRFLLQQLDGAIGTVFSREAYPFSGAISMWPILALTLNEQQTTPWLVKLPTQAQVDGWAAQLQPDTVRGVNDRVFVSLLTTRDVPLSIRLTPNTTEVQNGVLVALRNGFATYYSADGYTIPNSEISGYIATAPGVTDHTLDDVDGLGPGADAVADVETLLQVGVITWLP